MENLSHCLILQLILQAQKVLTLEFFAFKMPSSFSNSSHKQQTVCFPIVRTEKCRFSLATISLVFTELNYSDPLFCHFYNYVAVQLLVWYLPCMWHELFCDFVRVAGRKFLSTQCAIRKLIGNNNYYENRLLIVL